MDELERWNHDAPDDYPLAKRAYVQLGPGPDRLAHMLAHLETELDAPGATPSPPGHDAHVLGSAKTWFWLVAALLVLSGGAWLLRGARHERTAPAPQRAVQAATSAPSRALTPPAPQQAVSPPAAASAPFVASAARRTAATAPDPVAELALLERARRILSGDPVRALALTDEHRRSYRPGLFAEERELLAIEALVSLSRREAAERRARAFTRAHPSSVHAHRLEVILRGEAR